LLAGSCNLHQPSTTTNESSRLVGGFLGIYLASTTTNFESLRLVGGFLGIYLASTTTNESYLLVVSLYSIYVVE
jgi:Leu/Phe-tRNA-protein transferase